MFTFGVHGFGSIALHQQIGPLLWQWFDLIWVHKGHVKVAVMDTDELTLVDGSGVLIYPRTKVVGRSLTPSSRISVQHFSIARDIRPLLDPIDNLCDQQFGIRVYQAQPSDTIEHDIKRAVSLSLQPATPSIEAMRIAITLLILAGLEQRLVRVPIFRPERLAFDRLCQYLAEHTDRRVSLQEMADYVALSPSYFRKVFQDQFGISPGRFFEKMRIEEAARLLRETDRPIKRIAADIGLNHLPNFYRAFRRHTELTPAEYRRKYAPFG